MEDFSMIRNNYFKHASRSVFTLLLFLLMLLGSCGGGGDTGGSTIPSTEGPNIGSGRAWVVEPSNTGRYQTDRSTVRLQGGSFTPDGATCPTWTGVLPPGYTVTWYNSLNGASAAAQASLNCLVVVITGWDTGDFVPLAIGDNTITVTADDGAGNIGRDTIIITRVPDTTPPTVDWVLPVNGSVDVGINSYVEVAFSEVMDRTTINAATLTLTDSAGNPVPATVTYDSFLLRATLTPSMLLSLGTTYYFTVSTGVRDAPAGNPIAIPFQVSFTTHL